MKKWLVYCFLFSSIFFSHSQNNGSSVNLSNTSKTNTKDSLEVIRLNELSLKLRQENYDSALALGAKALTLSQKIQWPNGIAFSHQTMGLTYCEKGDYAIALQHYNKTLEMWNKMFSDLSKTEKANSPALNKAKERLSIIHTNIANVLMYQGNYSKSMEGYLKALKIDEEINDKAGIAVDLSNLGVVYSNIGDTAKSLDYHLKSLAIKKELGKSIDLVIGLGNVGSGYHERRDYAKALEYYFEALKLSEELNSKNHAAAWMNHIGLLYADMHDYSKAIDYYSKALEINETLGDKQGIMETHSNIGMLYLEQKKYKEAELNLIKSLSMAKEIGHLNFIGVGYKSISDLYLAKGDYKKAYEEYRQYIKINDSLINYEKSKELTQMAMNYDFKKQEEFQEVKHQNEVALFEKEQQIAGYKRYFLICIIVLISLMTVLLISRQRKSHRLAQELISAELQRQQFEAQHLKYELELRQEKLATYANLIQEKARVVEEMENELESYKTKNSNTSELTAAQLLKIVKESTDPEQYWEEFIMSFNLVYKDFLEKLHAKYPDLTRNEIRLCILIKCNFGNKEIARVLHISSDSVKKAHNRIRKKFKLEAEDNLRKFVQQLN